MGSTDSRKGTSQEIPKVTVLCGGSSNEREISILSGKNIFDVLKEEGVKTKLLVWDGNFEVLNEVTSPCFIALHGSPGEDGSVQRCFEKRGIKYTGSNAKSCELTYDKIITKEIFKKLGIKTPEWENKPREFPCVMKPRFGGSSLGIKLCFSKDDREHPKGYFYEKYIDGREISVSIVDVDGKPVVLPILEIIPSNTFYDYESKYNPRGAKLITPAPLTNFERHVIEEMSLKVYRELSLKDFARIDGIISKDGIYFLEVNSIPGMTQLSDLPASASAGGISLGKIALNAVLSALWR